MHLELSDKRYQIDIPQAVWPEFFDQCTDDNRGRLITLKLMDAQMGDFEVLRHKPLWAITYDRPDHGNDLVVTIGRSLGAGEATYAHRIMFPKAVSIITDEDGIILSCTVTDDDHAQIMISFQS
jgi:hypothetical protein